MVVAQIGSYPLDTNCIQGGVEASVYGLATELSITNNVHVFDLPRHVIERDSVEREKQFTLHRFSSVARSNYAALGRIGSIIQAIRWVKPDICHLHAVGLFQLLVYIALKVYRLPVIVTVHGLAHIEKQKEWRKQRSARTCLKYIVQSLTEFAFLSICPVVIVDTPYVADAIKLYKRQWKLLRSPVCKVIPQGIDERFFQIAARPQPDRVLSIGALSPRKGHLCLIDAIGEVRDQWPGLSVVIAGAATDSGYQQRLSARIDELGLSECIQLLPNVPFERIVDLYLTAGIFALHSEEESQGIVFCEAMAMGLPVVATHVGGIPWIITNQENGLLSAYGDYKQFAFHLNTLLTDDTLRSRMSAANQLKAAQFNWKQIVDDVQTFYALLINQRNTKQ